MVDLPLEWWAPIAAAIYFGISWFTGDLFPFSRYAMYSSAALRREGAVPVFVYGADHTEGRMQDYDQFVGIDPDAIYPSGFPCSLEWQVHEFERCLRQRAAPAGSPDGPVPVGVGFYVVRLAPDGTISHELKLTQQGTATPR